MDTFGKRERDQKVLELAQTFLTEPLRSAVRESNNEDEFRERLIAIAMALAMALSMLAEQFFNANDDPEEWGAQIGKYIGMAIKEVRVANAKTKAAEQEELDGTPGNSTQAGSLWGD